MAQIDYQKQWESINALERCGLISAHDAAKQKADLWREINDKVDISLSIRLFRFIDQIVRNEKPGLVEDFKKLTSEEVCILMDLERKLYALRSTVVKCFFQRS
jgi:hypothetical protein